MEGEKPSLTADDLAHIHDAGGDTGGEKDAGDKTAADVKASDADKGAKEPAKDAGDGKDKSDDADKGAKAPEGKDKEAGDKAKKPVEGKDKKPDALLGDDDDDDPVDDKTDDDKDDKGDKDAKAKAAEEFAAFCEKLAGGDEKMLKRLKRYKSVEAVVKAGLTAQDKIRSGEYKAKLPEDATEEEIEAYREANGIPKEAKAYDVPKVAGHKWTEADVPVLDRLKGVAHASNIPQGAFDNLTKFYAGAITEAKAAQEEARAAIDKADREAVVDALREDLGPEYRSSKKLLDRLIGDTNVFPEEVAEALTNARGPDGRRIIYNPVITRLLIDVARFGFGDPENESAFKGYGDGGLNVGGNDPKLQSRKEELLKVQNTDIGRFRREKNAKGQTLADELLEIERKEARQSRGRAA